MLTVVTPATATKLTTPTRVAAMLGLGSTEAESAAGLIGQASQAVVDYCRRPFAIETVREDFFEPCIVDTVLLGRDPVVEFIEVRDGEEIILASGYRYDAGTGLLARTDESGRWLSRLAGGISVTYRAGYVLPSDEANAPTPTLPDVIERATARLIGAYLSIRARDPLIKSEAVEGVGTISWYVPGPSSTLADPEAEALLRPYRRLF